MFVSIAVDILVSSLVANILVEHFEQVANNLVARTRSKAIQVQGHHLVLVTSIRVHLPKLAVSNEVSFLVLTTVIKFGRLELVVSSNLKHAVVDPKVSRKLWVISIEIN